MLENARKFVELVLPRPKDGEYINLHWRYTGTNGHNIWDGRAAKDSDELIKNLSWSLKGNNNADVYVCMSSQSEKDDRVSKKGYAYSKSVRSTINVVEIKSLYLDIDVKEGAYPTTRDALIALREFITATGMPSPSAVVASGSGGFHVHWAFEAPITREEWQPLADALSKATSVAGLMCDNQVTVDSARILRVPETFNHKTEIPREVKLLSIGSTVDIAQVKAALEPYMGAPSLIKRAPISGNISGNNDLGAGIEPAKAKPIDIEHVASACKFVKNTLDLGGAQNPNPLWFLSATLASFCEDGRAVLHRMSNGHPTYSETETDALYDRILAHKQDRDIGWPQCSKIAGYGCPDCSSCPLLAQGKSPLNHSVKIPTAPPDDLLPEGYFRSAEGIVFRRAVDDSGASIAIQICSYPMTEGWLSTNPWTLHFNTRTETGRKTSMEIPTETITAKDALPKYLGSKGIFLGEKQAKVLKEFLLSWITKLQQSKDTVVSSTPFGWSIVNGEPEGFTFAGRVWTDGDDRPAASPDPILSYQYTPKGSINPWLEMAKIITDQNRPDLDAIIASSFAAPLVRFTGESGTMLNCYSTESGIGKTTAMRTAQAVWGDPIKAMQALDDTSNSVLKKIGDIKALPLFWDELKTEQQTNKFVSMVFSLTGGREKTRLSADSTLKNSGSWQTMLISASNDSILDAMTRVTKSTTAGIYRMFEYVVRPATNQQVVDQGVVSRLLGKLNDNYGHAGLTYAQFLGANHKRIAEEIAALQDSLGQELKCPNEERFWLATITVILKGAEYANSLELTNIDLDLLKSHLVTVLGKMREEINNSAVNVANDMSVSAILAQLLSACRARHTLITNKIWVSKGRPAVGEIKILNDLNKLDGIYIHIGKDDGLMRISSTYFSSWMADHNYSRQAFTRKMKEDFGMKVVNGKLGGGTSIVGSMEYLLELDLNDHKLKEFVE